MSEPILLVEDDASVRTTIVTFLELEGFGVEAVSNTRDALDRLGEPRLSARHFRYLYRRPHRHRHPDGGRKNRTRTAP